MREVDTKELKSIQLDILNDVVSFCNAHEIRYSLAYGTLIGAIRHGGYIPWDDDIDLFMPRPDYDRFLCSFVSSENYVVDLSKQDNCIELFCKVCRKGTIMEDIAQRRRLWGICIDIFPIDGIPTAHAHEYYEAALVKWNMLPKVCPFYKGVMKHKAIWFSKYLIKKLIYGKFGDIRTLKENISAILKAGNYQHATLAGCYFGEAGMNEFMDKEVFEQYCKVSFEGKHYSATAQYDKYLRKLYGDYMQLPPPEKRVTHHLYHSYVQD